MLSLFPTLLAYEQLSPLLIRITLGLVMIYWCYLGLKTNNGTKKLLDLAQGILGAMLIVGAWTQGAAALAAIGFFVCILGKIRDKAFMTNGVNYIWILFVLALSLLFSGPGMFSIDYPL